MQLPEQLNTYFSAWKANRNIRDSLLNTADIREPLLQQLRDPERTAHAPAVLDRDPIPHSVPQGLLSPTLPSSSTAPDIRVSAASLDSNIHQPATRMTDERSQSQTLLRPSSSTPVLSAHLRPHSPSAASLSHPYPPLETWVRGPRQPYAIPLVFIPRQDPPAGASTPDLHQPSLPRSPLEMANFVVQQRIQGEASRRQIEDVGRQPRHCVKCGRVEFECRGAWRRSSCQNPCKTCGKTKECECSVPSPSKRFKPSGGSE